MKSKLIDNYGRIAKKLRVSVTDRCNMRCGYCMPKNNTKWFDSTEVLSFEEIIRLSSIFANLGVEKIRITGGEPRSEEHTSELQSLTNLVCRLLLEKKKKKKY